MNTREPVCWHILGAGAIGCLWAFYLHQAGYRVVLLTREARTSRRLHFKKDSQTESIPIEWQLVDNLDAHSNIENLFISTKAHHTLQALSEIKTYVSERADVIFLQNGMVFSEAKKLLPFQQCHLAITTDGAYRTNQLSVVHAGTGTTSIGCDETLLSKLPTGFLAIERCDDIEIRQWQKLAVNCAINALTAVYQCKNGDLLTSPEANRKIEKLCAEISAIGIAAGMEDAVMFLHATVKNTLQVTADNFSSMYQDIQHHRQTEIDWLNGYLCELADDLGLPCPENRQLVDAIKVLEKSFP